MRCSKILSISTLFVPLILGTLVCCKKPIKEESQVVSGLPYFNSADFTPNWNEATHKIPAFAFVNQDGDTITNRTFADKIYIADFFFTSCPGICPKLTKNMFDLQGFYKDDADIVLLSHTVMPWKDSVPLLRAYAQRNHVDSKKWHLVTGSQEDLYNMARYGYFADEDFTKTQDPDNFIHTENFILVDKKGHIRGVYNGTLPVDVERLKRHIVLLKQDT